MTHHLEMLTLSTGQELWTVSKVCELIGIEKKRGQDTSPGETPLPPPTRSKEPVSETRKRPKLGTLHAPAPSPQLPQEIEKH